MKIKPEWITSLLKSKFFGSCDYHKELRKNETNVFCIDCNLCFCKHCIASSTHRLHRWLQICKYVYQDVARLQDIQKFLDCSKIQTYKINGEKAVHLHPRPQSKDPKSSKLKTGASCEACGRHIQDASRFCSIACKVTIVAEMSNDDVDKMISLRLAEFRELSLRENLAQEETTNEKESSSFSDLKDSSLSFSTESSEDIQAWINCSSLKPKKKLHKRKGVPRRAPLR
ncbi:hypothetical protein U1Q18_001952 [Sarracenia purpurea var. burkii]